MQENMTTRIEVSISGVITSVFIAFKLSRIISWSWLTVFSPLLFEYGGILLTGLVFIILDNVEKNKGE